MVIMAIVGNVGNGVGNLFGVHCPHQMRWYDWVFGICGQCGHPKTEVANYFIQYCISVHVCLYTGANKTLYKRGQAI
jgi:type 1 glutamine amidotransferase